MSERERERISLFAPLLRTTQPCLPPLLSPLLFPHCCVNPFPIHGWYCETIGGYPQIPRTSIWRTTLCGEEGWGEREDIGWNRSGYSSCWPAALKTSSNEAEDGSRDEGFLERRGGEEMYLPSSLGSNRPSKERTKPRIQKSGQWWTQCQSEPDQIEVGFTNKLTIHRNSYVDMLRNYVTSVVSVENVRRLDAIVREEDQI